MAKKIGVLGGGQLGRMMGLVAPNYGFEIHFLDKDDSYPAGQVSPNFTIGNYNNFQDVLDFGRRMDVLTIEIENVNADALEVLESEGVKVYPQARVIKIIKDKGLQKQFYKDNGIPSADFQLFSNAEEIRNLVTGNKLQFPFVQKARTEGYDGRGVQVIRTDEDLDKLFDVPSVVENMVDIEMEISVIVAKDQFETIKTYPVVEMMFDQKANLLDLLICPARISDSLKKESELLAVKIAKAFNFTGILAVEMFITKNGQLLINEAAPRAHNSGHHTIDNNHCSQFDQLIRAISGLRLGDTQMHSKAVMLNLLGAPNHMGKVKYEGFEEILEQEKVYAHIYGKAITKPFRKMGHITILDQDLDSAIESANFIKNKLKAISYE